MDEYETQQARLPKDCVLWGNYGDGKWRVETPVSLGLMFASDTPKEAVDRFLSSPRAKYYK